MSLKTKTLKAVTCIGLLLGAAQASAALVFQVSTDPINVGDTFTVDVTFNDIFPAGAGHTASDELTSFGFDWGLSVAGLLATVGSPVVTPNLAPPYDDVSALSTADVVALAVRNSIVNDTNPVNAVLARFEFTALQVGSTVFSIDGSVPDPNSERGLYYVDLDDPVGFAGDLRLNVPVPATALLMAMGLGVAGFARRRG